MLYGGRPEDDTSPVASQANVLPFLRSCASIAPTFLSLGNHEWMVDDTDIKEIKRTGVTVLDNEWVAKDGLVIAGLTSGYVTDYRAFRAESDSLVRYLRREDLYGIEGATRAAAHKPETDWIPSFTSQPGYKIILSHHPEYYHFAPASVDLILSGHAHGGQIRMYNPFKREWRGTWSPGQGWWPRYTKGVYEGRLIVSAGLSNTTWVPRLFNPTEVVYIEGS